MILIKSIVKDMDANHFSKWLNHLNNSDTSLEFEIHTPKKNVEKLRNVLFGGKITIKECTKGFTQTDLYNSVELRGSITHVLFLKQGLIMPRNAIKYLIKAQAQIVAIPSFSKINGTQTYVGKYAMPAGARKMPVNRNINYSFMQFAGGALQEINVGLDCTLMHRGVIDIVGVVKQTSISGLFEQFNTNGIAAFRLNDVFAQASTLSNITELINNSIDLPSMKNEKITQEFLLMQEEKAIREQMRTLNFNTLEHNAAKLRLLDIRIETANESSISDNQYIDWEKLVQQKLMLLRGAIEFCTNLVKIKEWELEKLMIELALDGKSAMQNNKEMLRINKELMYELNIAASEEQDAYKRYVLLTKAFNINQMLAVFAKDYFSDAQVLLTKVNAINNRQILINQVKRPENDYFRSKEHFMAIAESNQLKKPNNQDLKEEMYEYLAELKSIQVSLVNAECNTAVEEFDRDKTLNNINREVFAKDQFISEYERLQRMVV